MSNDKIQRTARIYALQNAVQFDGKARIKAVTGKVIGVLGKDDFPLKNIISIVKSVVKEVNNIPLYRQITELENIAPGLLKKEKRETGRGSL